MRGKGQRRQLPHRRIGITPAYAGKRIRWNWMGDGRRDHPRICGEKFHGVERRNVLQGSPPHMRGKDMVGNTGLVVLGITPAYAGKRTHTEAEVMPIEDHPRICGEKISRSTPWFAATGSPPHMRGKGRSDSACSWSERITPAYAGKRLKRSRSTVPPVAIVPLFPSVCNKPVVSDGSPAGRDAPLFLPAENAVPASPAYNLRSL